jgi:hypothetical protein
MLFSLLPIFPPTPAGGGSILSAFLAHYYMRPLKKATFKLYLPGGQSNFLSTA